MHFIFTEYHESQRKIWITWFFHFIASRNYQRGILNLVKFYSVYQSNPSIKNVLSHWPVFSIVSGGECFEYSYASLFPLTFLSLLLLLSLLLCPLQIVFKLTVSSSIFNFPANSSTPYFRCFCNYFLHGCENGSTKTHVYLNSLWLATGAPPSTSALHKQENIIEYKCIQGMTRGFCGWSLCIRVF